MAKDKKNNAPTAPVTFTPENVIDEVKKGNILTPELKEKMDADLQKEKDEKIISETKRRITRINYKVTSGLVNLKNLRKLADMGLYNTRQQGRLQRFLTGFVVTEQTVTEFAKTKDDVLQLEKLNDEKKPTALIILVPVGDGKREEKTFKVGETVPAIIDYNEFDAGLKKLAENLIAMKKEIDKQFREDMQVIQKAAGDYWSEDWRWDVKVVGADGIQSNRWDLHSHRLTIFARLES